MRSRENQHNTENALSSSLLLHFQHSLLLHESQLFKLLVPTPQHRKAPHPFHTNPERYLSMATVLEEGMYSWPKRPRWHQPMYGLDVAAAIGRSRRVFPAGRPKH